MKKLFALLAVAGLVFAIGCAPESKPVKVDTKPDGTKTVEAEVKPDEKAEITVDDKGTKVEVTPEEKPAEVPPAEVPAEKPAEVPAEKPAEDKPAEDKPAEEKPVEEKKE